MWHYIYEDTKDKSCFTYCKQFQRAKNGRAAYVALKHHYLGADHVNQQASAAEGMMQNTIYTGKNWFTFEHYCTLHSQQHEILCGLQAHGRSGINEDSNVRHLNNGIKDTALERTKLATLADFGNSKDITTTVAYYKSVLTNHRTNHSRKLDVNIAGFGSGHGGREGQNKTRQGRDGGRHGQKREANGNWRNRTPVLEEDVELKHYNTK